MAPDEMRAIAIDLYRGCMRGRTMVVPFCMGPLGAGIPKLGVEILPIPGNVVVSCGP